MPEKRKLRVMIVEDNLADAKLAQKMLGQCERVDNEALFVCEDGQQAIDTLEGLDQSNYPDIVFLDLNVPKVNGLEVLAYIKSHDSLMRIPVVVLSSSIADRDVRTAYEYRANAYMRKAVDLDGYREMIKAFDGFWFQTCLLPGMAEELWMVGVNKDPRILYIEDDETDQMLFKRIWKKLIEQKVEIANNGEQAMSLLRQKVEIADPLPDLIFLDLNMPIMDGYETLSAIKQDSQLKFIPVIILSTSSQQRDVDRCYADHANAYVCKDIDYKVMVEAHANIYEYWCKLNIGLN